MENKNIHTWFSYDDKTENKSIKKNKIINNTLITNKKGVKMKNNTNGDAVEKFVKFTETIIRKNISFTIGELHELILAKKICIDDNVQSSSRWGHEEQCHYIHSLLKTRGVVGHSVNLINVTECLKSSDKNDIESIKYYSKWFNAGIEYLIEDGNNRIMCTLGNFLNNEIEFTYTTDSSNNIRLREDYKIFNRSKFYSWPKNLQEDFKSFKIQCQVYTKIKSCDIPENFLSSNSGKPLNDQEKLNSLTTKTPTLIREVANYISKDPDGKNIVCGGLSRNRRKLDYVIAKIMAIAICPTLISKLNFKGLSFQYRQPNSALNKNIEKETKSFLNYYNTMVKPVWKIYSPPPIKSPSQPKKFFYPNVAFFELYFLWKTLSPEESTNTKICLDLAAKYFNCIDDIRESKTSYFTENGENNISYSQLFPNAENQFLLLHRLKALIQNDKYPLLQLSSFYTKIYDAVKMGQKNGSILLNNNKITPLQTQLSNVAPRLLKKRQIA